VLHTGDVGRFDADGNLFLVDRKRSLIIRGGSNIYPAEVELVLGLDERVAGSALVPQPDARLGERTIAFVELANGASASSDELRAHCTEQLARYKVPDEIRIVDALPRNQLGKVNRAELADAVRREVDEAGQ
jgi:acyl-CoA synthetase (AMP-forming)/AMP-acid ligase II